MHALHHWNGRWLILPAAILLALLTFLFFGGWRQETGEQESEGAAKLRNSGQVSQEVVNAPAGVPVNIAPAGQARFTPQTRMGFTAGDQWEPAIAADQFGHVYIIYPQYLGVPGCPSCFSPTAIFQMSSDHGLTWTAPSVFYPAGETTGQVDVQMAVDPVDGRTVYASWLQDKKSSIVLAKSTDYGATWTFVVADSTNAGVDKDILAVRGQDIYIVYNHAQTVLGTASHDGGLTFHEVKVNQNSKLGWSLAGGGTVTPDGSAYFAWAGYTQNGGAKGPVNLYISKTSDGGLTWTTNQLDVSSSPPDCASMSCGWAFLGAQATMTSDADGTLYALWNAGSASKGPERIYFAKSTDGGNTWSPKADVSLAAPGVEHAFPAIASGGAGDVRIAWMDTRNAAPGAIDLWNVYYRNSTDGGITWSSEAVLSSYVSGFTYIFQNGFRFPFGDYFEMDVDEQGTTHAVWGEGYNYDTPGSIWYSQGK